MRHRSVYVDTAPRPAYPSLRSPTTKKPVRTSSLVLGGFLSVVSLGLLLSGLWMSITNSTRPLHRAMAKQYKQNLREWHHAHLHAFQPAEVTLVLNDKVHMPFHQATRPTKHSLHGTPPVSHPDDETDLSSAKEKAYRKAAAAAAKQKTWLGSVVNSVTGRTDDDYLTSHHVDFQVAGVMGKLSLPGRGEPLLVKPSRPSAVANETELAEIEGERRAWQGEGGAEGSEGQGGDGAEEGEEGSGGRALKGHDADEEEGGEDEGSGGRRGEDEEGEYEKAADLASQQHGSHHGGAWGEEEEEDEEDVNDGRPDPMLPRGRVTRAMFRNASFKIQIKTKRTESSDAVVSTLDLGRHVFARLGNVSARSRRDCRNNQWGAWDAPAKQCNTIDYLHEICVKVKHEETDEGIIYSLDHSHGNIGCYPKLHWRPEVWRRAKAQPLPHPPGVEVAWDGSDDVWEVTLPGAAAALAPKVTIRHAHDPEMQERAMLHKMVKEQQPRMAAHAIGLALMFLGLIGMCSLVCIMIPALAAMWQSDEDEGIYSH